MSMNLNTILERLGMTHKPRFTLEETAEILGSRRDQILDLLKRGKLLGVKASSSRWSGVFAIDLDNYIKAVNQAKPSKGPPLSDCNSASNSETEAGISVPLLHPRVGARLVRPDDL